MHCGALVFVAAFSFGGSWLLYKVTDLIIPLRVVGEQEEIGLDLSQHGEVMQDDRAAPARDRSAARKPPERNALLAKPDVRRLTDVRSCERPSRVR